MKMKQRINWRDQNDLERDILEGELAATVNNEEPITQQQFRDAADINILVKRFGLEHAPIPVGAFDPSYYGDFTDVPDLRTAMDRLNDARDKFMSLPPKLRARFNNNLAQLWDFVNDPENAEEAVRLGLFVQLQSETPPAVEPEQGTSTS